MKGYTKPRAKAKAVSKKKTAAAAPVPVMMDHTMSATEESTGHGLAQDADITTVHYSLPVVARTVLGAELHNLGLNMGIIDPLASHATGVPLERAPHVAWDSLLPYVALQRSTFYAPERAQSYSCA